MSGQNVLTFLRLLGQRLDLLDELKLKSKDEVIAAAAAHGLPFTEPDFDPLIWGLEVRLAEHRGEPFDAQFPLWQTMWGQYYLEYLALDLIPALDASSLI
jgi:hypothetical protein